MDNAYYTPQLAAIQTQMQQLQNILGQKPPVMPTQAPSTQAAPRSVSFVKGISGAREYLSKMPPNSSDTPFDLDESVFYMLSTDANGTPAPIKIGDFTLRDAPEPGDNTLTKADLDAFKAEIREAIAAMAPKTTRKKEAADE